MSTVRQVLAGLVRRLTSEVYGGQVSGGTVQGGTVPGGTIQGGTASGGAACPDASTRNRRAWAGSG